jgi:hypothetical protein
MIGVAQAQQHAGIENEGAVRFDQTEQSNARRELLRVEKQAIRDKELNKKSEQNYIDSIREMVHQSLQERLEERLKDIDDIYLKVLGVDENLPPLIDILSVKASSISRIEPAASAMPWLYDDLIKMVNLPKYRRTDSRGKVISVDTMRVALSFLGVDNLKMVVPSLALRRWIPQITDPYPEIKSRLWESAIGTSMACKTIAEVSGVDGGHAFILGLLQDIGISVLVRLYFKLFDELQREALIEAHHGKKREEHAALTKITPSADFLIYLIETYSSKLSYALISKMNFRRVVISNAMDENVSNVAITEMSSLGKVLSQGRAYSRYRMLKSYKLINMEEAKGYLRQFQMPPGALSALKTLDLRHLNLKIDED